MNDTTKIQTKKSILTTRRIIILCIIVLLLICGYFYNTNLKNLNKTITGYNNLVLTENNNTHVSVLDLQNYSNKYQAFATSFKEASKDIILDPTNQTLALNDADLSQYYSYVTGFKASAANILESLGTPSSSNIQNAIDNLNGLLKNDTFIKLNNLYTTSNFVSTTVSKSIDPSALKALINKVTNYISSLNNLMTDIDIDALLSGHAIPNSNNFTYTNANEDNNNNNNSSATDTNNTTSNTTSNNETKNTNSAPLSFLANKYSNLISQEQYTYGNSEQLTLGNNKAVNTQMINSYYNTWNNMLNDLWADLKANLPANQMKALTTQEINWVNSKETKSKGVQGEMTERRVNQLLDKYVYGLNM